MISKSEKYFTILWLRARQIKVAYALNGVFLYLSTGCSSVSAPLQFFFNLSGATEQESCNATT